MRGSDIGLIHKPIPNTRHRAAAPMAGRLLGVTSAATVHSFPLSSRTDGKKGTEAATL